MIFGRYSCLGPQGKLYWVEPDGTVFSMNGFLVLAKQVRMHREEHGGDLSSNWLHRFGTDYCYANPDCKACRDEPAPLVKVVSMGDISNFLRSMYKWSKSSEVITQEVAEERATICMGCPLNVEIVGCQPCFGLASKVRKVIGDVSTKYDDSLHGCYACGCNLKLKIWCPSDVVAGTKNNDFLPDYCWMKD